MRADFIAVDVYGIDTGMGWLGRQCDGQSFPNQTSSEQLIQAGKHSSLCLSGAVALHTIVSYGTVSVAKIFTTCFGNKNDGWIGFAGSNKWMTVARAKLRSEWLLQDQLLKKPIGCVNEHCKSQSSEQMTVARANLVSKWMLKVPI